MSDVATPQRPLYAVTLDVPNASKPSFRIPVDIHNIFIGPKRTVCRRTDDYFSQPEYDVPEPSTWTLDTVRALLHEWATFLPEELTATYEAGVQRKNYRGQLSGFGFVVRATRNEQQAIEVSGYIEADHFSEPMRALLSNMPSELAPLAGLRDPDTIGLGDWEKKYGLAATVDDARRTDKLVKRIKLMCYSKPRLMAALEALVNAYDPHGETEDE